MAWTNPQFLVETDWLAVHLDDPTLRVLECTTILHPRPEGGYRAESGRAMWAAGHIPRSGFADLTDDLSDRTSSLLYMMPTDEEMATVMARLGVGEGTRVVLYGRAVNVWAARVWWMLRAVGFDDAAVVNGGWKKWTVEGRSTSTEPCAYPPARFVARPRPELFVGKREVLAGLGERAHRRQRERCGAVAGRPEDARVPARPRAARTIRRGGGRSGSGRALPAPRAGGAPPARPAAAAAPLRRAGRCGAGPRRSAPARDRR